MSPRWIVDASQDDFELDLFNSYKSQRPQTLEGFVNKSASSTTTSLLNQAAASDAQDWEFDP